MELTRIANGELVHVDPIMQLVYCSGTIQATILFCGDSGDVESFRPKRAGSPFV
jgi:hypothetical protein